MTNTDDTASSWHDIADQLTAEQITELERHASDGIGTAEADSEG
jgi:hypothetical protein